MRAVLPLDEKQAEWVRQRRALERETRILVIEEDRGVRSQLGDLLYRHRVPARAAGSAEQALSLLSAEGYPLLLVSETLSGLGGLYLVRQLRATFPDVDVVITSWDPTVELFTRAFDLHLLDVIRKPLPQFDAFGRQVRTALRRSVERRLRVHVLRELRECLQLLEPELRAKTTGVLERRLIAFKRSLGAFDRVLVVEQEDLDLRLLSENLLLAGLHVETVANLADGLRRVAGGDIHLLALNAVLEEQELDELLLKLRAANPLIELLLVTTQPSAERAHAALRLGAGTYLPWPPPSASSLVLRVQDLLKRSRRERLVDNLLAELFRETSRALRRPNLEESFSSFCQLIGLERVRPGAGELAYSAAEQSQAVQAVEYLDEVLDGLLTSDEEPMITLQPDMPAEEGPADQGSERRQHLRVPESQFIRFRPKSGTASNVALLGDLSEGGLFVRTGELLLPGTLVEVDFNVEHGGLGYLVRCRGQVAWVARDDKQCPMGPGFGIKFVEAPREVLDLIEQVVAYRLNHPAPSGQS